MNNKRKRELTRLRVRKHRAFKRQLNEDRFDADESRVSSDSDVEEHDSQASRYLHNESEEISTCSIAENTEDEHLSVYMGAAVHLVHEDNSITSFEEEQGIEHEVEDQEEEEEEEHEELREEQAEREEQEDPDEAEEDEVRELKKWIIKSGINFVHVDSLLQILRRRLLPQLPKSHKTLLQTSAATYNIEDMEDAGGENGQFVYFGISQGLRACINENLHPDAKIPLQINVDGIPIFKSSHGQFWPILCKVFHSQDVYKPFPIAIYFGASKPKYISQYLHKFIEEMNVISAEGISINETLLTVYIQCFICDTPARSMLKCVKGHTGFYACERCEVRGYKVRGSTIFLTVDNRERTNEAFRNQEQPQHYNGISPLLDLNPPIDMIELFLLDSLHLFPIGIGKKLMVDYWLFGKLHVRLGRRYRVALSERMEYLKAFIPCEFQRKPRSVKYIAKWKGTELRFFLLYCGPIVLKDILSPALYQHFLLLHAAYRILCSPELALKYNRHASQYLKSFFLLLKEYYGRESQIMNAHNLIHVADDVRRMNCNLSAISAFPFENMLGTVIKKCVRTPNRPLAQICRRLSEQQGLTTKAVIPPKLVILKWKSDDILEDTFSIQKLKFKEFTLTTAAPNDKVLLRTGEVLKVTKMFCPTADMENVTIEGLVWKIKQTIYTFPCNSKHLKMWELTSRPSSRELSCNIHSIQHKMVLLALPRQILLSRTERKFIMPLLHTTKV